MASDPKKRLHFLDALRAFAILMMLQGHFIDTMLAPEFRDPENSWFAIWLYMRGITAPVFFTISGTIFTYLLIRWEGKVLENPRIKKGLRRGAYLVLMGYLLRMNLVDAFLLNFSSYVWVVDVLHCIGFSLFAIVLLYVISYGKVKFLFPMLALGLGVTIFLFERNYYDMTMDGWPLAIQNYFVRNNSVFTILPWLGYSLIGAFLGTVFHWLDRVKWEHKLYALAGVFLLLGWLLMEYSAGFLMRLHYLTDAQMFRDIAYFNYLFQRLGNVFLIFGLFMLLEKNWPRFPVFLEMGQSTLAIYIAHFVVLYGSWFALGLNRFFAKELEPVTAIAGAVLFMIGTCVMVYFWNRKERYAYLVRRNR